jgi:hypothetical protein
MTDVWATEERIALRKVVRDFTEREIVPHLAQWEEDGEVPRSLHKAAAEAGLLGTAFPEAVGGQGGTTIDNTIVTEVRAVHPRHRLPAHRAGRRPGADRQVRPSDACRRQDRLAGRHRARCRI